MSQCKCFKEGCEENAPYGFRLRGPFSSLPPGKRGSIWTCKEHREEARKRKEKAEKV